MSNIQKSFKKKSELRCMADGGPFARSRDDVLAEALGEAGVSSPVTPKAEAPAPAPAPAPEPEKEEESGGFIRAVRDFVGLRSGGKIEGPGGPTEDKVGPVMLSDGEYVLPADTVDAVGVENLEALRAATHTPVKGGMNPRAQRSTLRLKQMANGGPALTAAQEAARRAGLSGGPYNVPTAAPTPAAAPAAAPAVPAARAGMMARTGSVLRGAARVGAPIAGIAGAMDSFADNSSGFREHQQQLMGAGPDRSPLGDVARDVPRVLANVGDAATFGLAGRVGRGLSEMNGGKGFIEGFMGPSDRDQFNASEMRRVMGADGSAGAPSASQPTSGSPLDPKRFAAPIPTLPQNTGGDPSRPYAATQPDDVIGQFNGRDITRSQADMRADSLQTASFAPKQAQSTNPMMDELRSALRGMGNSSGGMGSGGRSNAEEINKRYDSLADDMRGMYSRKGQGNLARRLLELETARSNALEGDGRNLSTLRGQDGAARIAADNNRMQGIKTLADIATGEQTAMQAAQAAQLKALQDAQEAARKGEEQGFERYTGAIENMFIDPATGEADKGAQERFTSFIQASDPKAAEKFSEMQPQDQMLLLQNFKKLYDMNEARNASSQRNMWGGTTTNRADMPVNVRESEFNDVINGDLTAGDYVYSQLPFTNPNVVETESGSTPLLSNIGTDENGNWDADRLELIRQRTGRDKNGRRSALRGE